MHWADSVDDNHTLINKVQQGTTDEGMLSQASGVARKQEICLVYFLSYKFVNGRARSFWD